MLGMIAPPHFARMYQLPATSIHGRLDADGLEEFLDFLINLGEFLWAEIAVFLSLDGMKPFFGAYSSQFFMEIHCLNVWNRRVLSSVNRDDRGNAFANIVDR